MPLQLVYSRKPTPIWRIAFRKGAQVVIVEGDSWGSIATVSHVRGNLVFIAGYTEAVAFDRNTGLAVGDHHLQKARLVLLR